jgi:hypothetical protein
MISEDTEAVTHWQSHAGRLEEGEDDQGCKVERDPCVTQFIRIKMPSANHVHHDQSMHFRAWDYAPAPP